MSDWLDLELSEHLAPVAAPDELWDRLCTAGVPARRTSRVFALPVAAVVTLILAGALWFMARGQTASPALRQFAAARQSDTCLQCHI
jgi:hypothetical protein